MNDRFDLRIITQPHSQVYWGYFRRLVFGNSSTKHNKLAYFSNSMLFCSDVLLPFSHIPRCIHAKTPDFPRLFEPREYATLSQQTVVYHEVHVGAQSTIQYTLVGAVFRGQHLHQNTHNPSQHTTLYCTQG